MRLLGGFFHFLTARQRTYGTCRGKKLKTRPRNVFSNFFGVIAQLVERYVRNVEVVGSTPIDSTKIQTPIMGVFQYRI